MLDWLQLHGFAYYIVHVFKLCAMSACIKYLVHMYKFFKDITALCVHQNELLTCDPMHLGFIKYWLKIEFCIHLQTNTVLQFFLRIYLHYYYHHHTTTAIIKLQIDITRLICFFNISLHICIADLLA